MAFHKKTIKDVNLDGKKVLLRADYNVPVDNNGKVLGPYRILKSIPTVEYLLKKNCKIVIISHLGRPEVGRPMPKDSLRDVARYLGTKLDKKVNFVADCCGPKVQQACQEMKQGEIVMLENLRLNAGEKDNDKDFAKQLAEETGADMMVQDAFGVVHRADASTEAITKLLPSVAGLLLESEYQTIVSAVKEPERPLMAIIGGAKISDKIGVIEKLIETADIVAVGGAMANMFLVAQKVPIGSSLIEKSDISLAKKLLSKAHAEAKKRHFVFYIPQDGVVARSIDKHAHTRVVDWTSHVAADIESYPKSPKKADYTVTANEKILDIGPYSCAYLAGAMQMVKTVIWNGPLGVTEVPSMHGPVGPFGNGTEVVMESLMGEMGDVSNRPYSLVGGGDTAGYIEARGLTEHFNHVSTGGGASLDLIAGKKLAGVEALQDK